VDCRIARARGEAGGAGDCVWTGVDDGRATGTRYLPSEGTGWPAGTNLIADYAELADSARIIRKKWFSNSPKSARSALPRAVTA